MSDDEEEKEELTIPEARRMDMAISMIDSRVNAYVKFPKWYHKTKFREAPWHDGTISKRTLVYVKASVSENTLFVHQFYSKAADDSAWVYVRPSERPTLKGVGAKLLCAVVGALGGEVDKVSLEASGGTPWSTAKFAEEFGGLTEAELRQRLLDISETFYASDGMADEDASGLLETLVNYHSNQKLVTYYEQFGFRRDPARQPSGFADVPMLASVQEVQSHCSER